MRLLTLLGCCSCFVISACGADDVVFFPPDCAEGEECSLGELRPVRGSSSELDAAAPPRPPLDAGPSPASPPDAASSSAPPPDDSCESTGGDDDDDDDDDDHEDDDDDHEDDDGTRKGKGKKKSDCDD